MNQTQNQSCYVQQYRTTKPTNFQARVGGGCAYRTQRTQRTKKQQQLTKHTKHEHIYCCIAYRTCAYVRARGGGYTTHSRYTILGSKLETSSWVSTSTMNSTQAWDRTVETTFLRTPYIRYCCPVCITIARSLLGFECIKVLKYVKYDYPILLSFFPARISMPAIIAYLVPDTVYAHSRSSNINIKETLDRPGLGAFDLWIELE